MLISLIITLYLPSLVICQSLSDVTNDLFGRSKNGVVAAFGDFNADKLTDIFVLTDEGKTVHLLEAEHDMTKERASFFRKMLIGANTAGKTFISSLVPGDFDGDAMMDLLITRKKEGAGSSDPVTVQVYWGNSITNNLGANQTLQLNEKLRDQPSVVDVNGDMIPDLLGETSEGERCYFIFRNNRSYTVEKVENGSSPLDPLRVPQSSAFFDFNGDLVPDLCMVSENNSRLQFEIWLNEEGVLRWSQTILSPPEMKQFGRASFHDLNDNREINIILPGCLNKGKDCAESVVYVWGRGGWHDLHVDFSQGSETWQFAMNSNMHLDWLSIPLALRIGDFNLDGFPDALAVLKTSSNDSYGVFLMLNVGSTSNFSRTFHFTGGQPLSGIVKEPPVAAFYDFMENGILDVLLTVYTNDATELRALEQDFKEDAYFLKVMVVSGLCSQHCANGHEPYGVNQVGPVIRFRTTTSHGDTEIGVASQLSQSAYYSLQLPFEVFGLGQTPNFVDVLEVGIQNPPKTSKRQRSWPSIIPNAQVVVIPVPTDNPSRWTMKLFVTPSRMVLLTGASLLGTCAFIAIVIVLLHWKERVEDKREKLQEAQRFHFDAM
ncbi:T-cell immunomodulatory protein-like [Babylonia areolata]|uniref:T-cell immunomodulatory protein-like n=1 Tax=Babylonia areolata TaxID=304850 RepID=UPI003FD20151